MKTLLVALGILASFGALFWLDRYYKGGVERGVEDGPEETGAGDTEAPPESE